MSQSRTRLERSLARMLAFVAGVHALIGIALFRISGRWVTNDEQAVLATVGLIWSIQMALVSFVAVLILLDRRKP